MTTTNHAMIAATTTTTTTTRDQHANYHKSGHMAISSSHKFNEIFVHHEINTNHLVWTPICTQTQE
jgi:hypothetical protein